MSILCATDFSKPAMEAADIAASLAKKLTLPLRLVHCAQDWVVTGDLPLVMPDDQLFRDQLKREADRLRSAGVEVTEDLRHGSPSFAIVDAASMHPTSCIVLGSTGKGLASRWLIGSVAERVAEGAAVPTLVVRQPELLRAWLNGESALRLLCAVDFTKSADAAIAAMKTFVTIGGVEIEAAYVPPVEDLIASKEQQIIRQRDVWERLHAVLGDMPVKVHVRKVTGQPADDFLHTADEQKSGLLVVGTHQKHGWQRLKSPSFSRSTLAHATTNVLCAPAARGVPDTSIPEIRRILLATNFTDVCAEAFRHAHSLLPGGGAIRLVHVCPEPSSGINPVIASEVYFDHSIATAREKSEATEKLKALPAELLARTNVAISTEILIHDDIATALCEAAERFGADVICMGTKGHSRTGAALLGSTVQSLLAKSHKPVFVVTPPLV
jgi:nucleotide-binding universal stress UspA family protein